MAGNRKPMSPAAIGVFVVLALLAVGFMVYTQMATGGADVAPVVDVPAAAPAATERGPVAEPTPGPAGGFNACSSAVKARLEYPAGVVITPYGQATIEQTEEGYAISGTVSYVDKRGKQVTARPWSCTAFTSATGITPLLDDAFQP